MSLIANHIVRQGCLTRPQSLLAALSGILALCLALCCSTLNAEEVDPTLILENYCADCHDEDTNEGDFDLYAFLDEIDLSKHTLMYENLVNDKMPPANKKQPSAKEKALVQQWLADKQKKSAPKPFRRLSRHEFVRSINDLLGTEIDLTAKLSEDRGSRYFDTDREIEMSREMLSGYFSVAEELLDQAFPVDGFPNPGNWQTSQVKESHKTYKIYHRPYRDGILFSWTRANNGNSYSFFYDHFEPPVSGWYELTFDAAKVGDFPEDIALSVYRGKHYIADDRPQPQTLMQVISIGSPDVRSHTIKVWLEPGENVSVHCYSKHNFRQKDTRQGIYIEKLTARGPLQSQWPPAAYTSTFHGLPISAPDRPTDPTSTTRVTVDSGGNPDDVLQQVIHRLSERAFTASLLDEQLAPYHQVAATAYAEHGDLVQAARQGIKAIICSPRFLTVANDHSSPSYAAASLLARSLWLSVPDTDLLAVAREGGLDTEASQRQAIERMLADPKSQRMVRSFCDQWLNLRSWRTVAPSLKLYPKYNDLLDHYLPRETLAYLNHLIQENQPISHLIDSDYSFLNQRLAQHYGIDGVYGHQLRKVSFSPDSPRGGLLTMGSIMKVTTDGYETSPILRGVWISKNIVGTPLSPPSEPVEAIEPEHGEHALSLKEQIEQHREAKACYACHKSIDPYGFALENFDPTGQWRDRYRVKTAHRNTFTYRHQGFFELGGPVDASNEIAGQPFEDIFGLKSILLEQDRRIAFNIAKKLFEYINGYQPDLAQRQDLLAKIPADQGGYGMRDLISDVLVYSIAAEKGTRNGH